MGFYTIGSSFSTTSNTGITARFIVSRGLKFIHGITLRAHYSR
jgi:hypothetical protein